MRYPATTSNIQNFGELKGSWIRELKKSVMTEEPPSNQANTPDRTRIGPIGALWEFTEIDFNATAQRLYGLELSEKR